MVATPIGNLDDLSARALKTLSEVDFVAAEDTRNSLRLLKYFEISKPLVSYHEHNRRERGMEIADRLAAGESCALITDAGTPAVSDPGADLVALCAERGLTVTSVPGACALINALILSALPTDRFVFEGFLPVPNKERKERLADLAREKRTFLLHEAPHKLRSTLADLEKVLGGERRITLCREMTKLNEEILRLTLSEAVAYYREKEPRGEYVLVLEGSSDSPTAPSEKETRTPEEAVNFYMEQGMTRKEALRAAAQELGLSRNDLYRLTMIP